MKFVLLPGMDGTGLLFEPLLNLWTEATPPAVLSYPADRILSYEQIESDVLSQLPVDEPYILIAESYSGPIAVRIAAKCPPMLRGLVLSATFVQRPGGRLGKWCRFLVGPYLFSGTAPRAIAKKMLQWQGLPYEKIQLWLEAFEHLRSRVLAARLKEILEVDVLEDLKKCEVPILCLYGKKDLLLSNRSHELIYQANSKVKRVGLDTPHFLLQAKPAEALHEIQIFTQILENSQLKVLLPNELHAKFVDGWNER